MRKQTLRKILSVLVLSMMLSACAAGTGTMETVSAASAEEMATERTAAPELTESAAPANADAETLISDAEPAEEVTDAEAAEAVKSGTEAAEEVTEEEGQKTMLRMKIGDTTVEVDWEENNSVTALKELCKETPLTIQMSMYGGFEQVGPIGTALPSDDAQTRTEAGDIVLYSGNQIVVFYGSNSWAYTRLGHITDRDAAGMAELLGNGDVKITIDMEVSK